MHATPRASVRTQMAVIAEMQAIPSRAHGLADDTALYAKVSDGIGSLYTSLLGPHWDQITTCSVPTGPSACVTC